MVEYLSSHKHPPTGRTAAYYRAKNIAAVIFPVDAGARPVSATIITVLKRL
jgi:hypothetical protein